MLASLINQRTANNEVLRSLTISNVALSYPDSSATQKNEFLIAIRIELWLRSDSDTKSFSTVPVSTWKRIARLARIAVSDDDIVELSSQLNSILGFIEQLKEANVEGVEPMTSVTPMKLLLREDKVTDGGDAARVLANAPQTEEGFFVVPKVVE
jgi:aspartyl-tRNA(Asn)/glutamyl-tRNA(Gln) amidotransferase subunit C